MALRAVVWVALGICLYGAAKPPVTLNDVRFSSEGNTTKVVLELSGKFDFASEKIEDPDRIFFDFLETKPKAVRSMVAVKSGQLRQIRVGESKPKVTRVVFDLEGGSVKYKTTLLQNPNRLVVELTSNGAAVTAVKAEPKLEPKPVASPSQLNANQGIELRTPAPASAVSKSKKNVKALVPPVLERPRISTARVIAFSPPPTIQLASTSFDWRKSHALGLPKLPEYKASSVAKASSSPRASAATIPNEPVKKEAPVPDSLIRALGLKIRRIVIDPGHGGHDQGSSGPTGLLEKELVLDVSRRLGKLVEEKMGSEVIYTREDDRFVQLEERPRIANQAKADLFLSIHANSSVVKAATGVETYYLSFTTSKQAMEVAARENATSGHSVSELRDLLQKIAFKDKVDESREFASRLLGNLIKTAPTAVVGAQARNRGVKKAPFIVLIGANMPSVLAEIGFISNPKDEQMLKKPEQRQKMAEALFTGLMQYSESLGYLQVAKTGTLSTE